jgi:hypothetical protein
MNRFANLLLASTLAASMTIPAVTASAQDSYPDRGPPQGPSYADRNDQYQADQAAYDAQMRDYNAARDQYEHDRAAYDRRYGDGSYERTYGPFGRYAPPPPRSYVDASASVPEPAPGSAACADARADAKSNRVGGTLLGAVIGGALGSNLAGRHDRGAGTVLGAVAGGAIGNSVGGNTKAGHYAALCDRRGAYFTYDQTYPYREGPDWVPPGDRPSHYYTDNHCRLAPAETDTGEYRYVRVCPDEDGRYRLAV